MDPLPPHDRDAEIAVVGSLLLNPDVMAQVMAILTPEDFYDPRCRKVFAVQRDLGRGLDLLTVAAELEARGWMDEVGAGFLTGSVARTPYSFHGVFYANVVRDLALRRRLIQLGSTIVQMAYAPGEETCTEEILATFSQELLSLCAPGPGASIPAPEAARKVQEQVARWAADPMKPADVRGLSSGLPLLDDLLNGMRPGDLILLAARPSMGKSALGFEIARRVASRGDEVLVFSLEMGSDQVVARWASALSGVHGDRVERGPCPPEYAGTAMQTRYLSQAESDAYQKALETVEGYTTLTINDQPALSAEQIRAQALAHAAKAGRLDLVVVDHTGLIDPGPARRYETDAKREGAKSRAMKALAKDLAAPVLLLQQLNRGVESRSNKSPCLADLRDSGEHEENADVVLSLYSEQYYKRELGDEPDNLKVKCLKHRHGPRRTCTVLAYERPLSRFCHGESG